MAREPFLINPPRRRRAVKKRTATSWKKRTDIPWYERIPGRRYAPRPKGEVKKKSFTMERHDKMYYPASPGSRRKNPFGEEVILVGANPRRRSRRRNKTNVPRRHRRSFRMNAPRRRYRKHGRSSFAMAPRRRRRSNPIHRRRHHRRHRRNPVEMSIMKPSSMLMPIAIGIAAKMAIEKIPAMLGLVGTGMTKYLYQAGVMVAGGWAAKKFIGKDAGMIFMLVSGVTIAGSILNEYVLGAVATTGYGAYIPYVPPTSVPGGSLSGFTDPYSNERYQY